MRNKTNSPIKPVQSSVTENVKIKKYHQSTKSNFKGQIKTINKPLKTTFVKHKKRKDLSRCASQYIKNDNCVNMEIKHSNSFTPNLDKREKRKGNLISGNKSVDDFQKQIKVKKIETLFSGSRKSKRNKEDNRIYLMNNTFSSASPNFVSLNKKQLTPIINSENETFSNQNNNSKYDDKSGYYIIAKGEKLMFRYEIIKLLGKGSFGQAVECYDQKMKEYVCIKIIKSKKKYYDQSLSEIEILNYLKSHQLFNQGNIVLLKDTFFFRNHMVNNISNNSV